MTFQQCLAFFVIGAMMVAFLVDRFRYDIVACCALMLGVAVGIVPFENAFDGFSDDIVIIVASALIVSAGVARSGLVDAAIERYMPRMGSVRGQMAVLLIVVTVLSAFIKNIGALAIMMPVAFQFARRSGVSPSVFLMPMAFGSLLGGLMTQIGTSPNIVVSRVRAEMTGESFTMFDFTPVGATLAVVGILFLLVAYRLVPQRTGQAASIDTAIEIGNYASEATLTPTSTVVGKALSDLVKIGDGNAIVTSIIRGQRRLTPFPDVRLEVDDVLLLEGDSEALDRIISQGRLKLSGDRLAAMEKNSADIEAVEVVISSESSLSGTSAQRIALFNNHNINLLAVSRKGQRLKDRLAEITLQAGDVIVLQGGRKELTVFLQEFACLPLAQRKILLGTVRQAYVPLFILLVAMGSTALGVLPVTIAFFAAALAMAVFKIIPLRELYHAVDGPILVMLAALIPVSDSLRTSGGTDVIAGWLGQLASSLPPFGALVLILCAAMAVTPFLNNAATVLVMAPIAASFASSLGFRPEAFLMAVAIGAGCDFLTPIGHQCNTLVMGPGGYRFSDYPRLGLPLSMLIILVTVPLLMVVWPLR
ncbi:anion permease [Rhizobium sp. CFBP 8762]|uniref:SLC13 family permease n=1 Tax=Rhizobium sp. CFBP 8762 TaxID=2775279 RepID=UPI0017835692|nr:SLC13 family permease [Rhizobium sp. CFBP 8762]MBD8554755.1 anion permease [Rhizobium sp. CFBP 8762]